MRIQVADLSFPRKRESERGEIDPRFREDDVLKGVLRSATRELQEAGIPQPRREAEWLLAHRLGCQPVELCLESPAVDPRQEVRFRADVAARAGGMPLQYLLGSAEFFGREFAVGPGVFIPRPETEVLVEVVLSRIQGGQAPGTGLRPVPEKGPGPFVVDVGTGCGAIAVTLALEHPGLQVNAVDRSSVALSFARRNAGRHQAAVSFLQGDLLAPFAERSVDLVAANLPYLDSSRSSGWPRELHWEPRLALDGGEAGLSMIQRMMRQAAFVLKPKGALVLEMGEEQAEALADFAAGAGLKPQRVVKDLAGRNRVVVFQRA